MCMDTDTQWTFDRIRLYKLQKRQPNWTQQQLADALNYSLSWVKKWLRRIREATTTTLETFRSRSRAPKQPARKVTARIREVILHLRATLPDKYGRVVGAAVIVYHLHADGYFTEGEELPTSPTTIHNVLKAAGYVPEKRSSHQPLPLVAPMSEWEFDFGTVKIAEDAQFEIAPLIDRGTSILVDVPAKTGTYQADTALEMLIAVFREHGYPQRLRIDRDPRLIGSMGMDEFPSALMRFAWCIGMEPVLCAPRRPDEKPYVERSIRTLKHECLYRNRPATLDAMQDQLEGYLSFYNHERVHRGFACRNRPPRVAFPDLPPLRPLPARVNPDAWVDAYHGEVFRRQVSSNGSISVDNHYYHIGRQYGLKVAAVHLDARERVFHITVGGERLPAKPIRGLHLRFMAFEEYAATMIAEAQAIVRQQRLRR